MSNFLLASFLLVSSPIFDLSTPVLDESFSLTVNVSGGLPPPPLLDGTTCHQVNVYTITTTNLTASAHCNEFSVGRAGFLIYEKTRSLRPQELSTLSKTLSALIRAESIVSRDDISSTTDDHLLDVSIRASNFSISFTMPRNSRKSTSEIENSIATIESLVAATWGGEH